MNPYIELLRVSTGALTILGVIIGAVVASVQISATIILAIVAAFLINSSGNVINDYFDYKIDKINKPKRPIPSGRIKRNTVLGYFFLLVLVGLVLSYFVSMHFLYIAIVNAIVLFVYSWKLKGTPLIGNITVSWLAASTFLAGALISYTFYSLPAVVVILASIAFLGTLSREIFKDAEDTKGDRKFGAKTLPIIIGEFKAEITASIVLVIAVLSLLLPVYQSLFNYYYYIGMIPAIVICLVAIAKMKKPHKSQKLIKIAMYFVFLGFILGSIL